MDEQIADAVRRVRQDGFTILEGVIPADRVDGVRSALVDAQLRQREASAAAQAAIRAKGHRVGVEGVAGSRGIVNETQAFAPWLAEARIMGVTRAFFGDHVRISCTDCVINQPGCGRGYWHADWPYNQTNASHIPAPYPDTLLHLSTIWMLTDFTPENGGTLLVPGSHRSEGNPSADSLGRHRPRRALSHRVSRSRHRRQCPALRQPYVACRATEPLRRRSCRSDRAVRALVVESRADAPRIT